MIEREQLALTGGPNQGWSIDLEMDALSNGRRLKCLTVVDDFTKEAVDIVAEHGMSGLYVARPLLCSSDVSMPAFGEILSHCKDAYVHRSSQSRRVFRRIRPKNA